MEDKFERLTVVRLRDYLCDRFGGLICIIEKVCRACFTSSMIKHFRVNNNLHVLLLSIAYVGVHFQHGANVDGSVKDDVRNVQESRAVFAISKINLNNT